MKKILFVSEYLNPPFDEGIKKTAKNFLVELSSKHEVLSITRHGEEGIKNQLVVDTNPLFLDKNIKQSIKEFNPDVLIYLPFASTTLAGYLRMRVLSIYCKDAKQILIALQPKELSILGKIIARIFKPSKALTPSPELKAQWDILGINSDKIPLYTHIVDFKINKDPNHRKNIRKKYNIPIDAYVIIHLGHLNSGRNLESLIPLQNDNNQVVVVGSSSTPDDAKGTSNIKSNLIKNGVIVLDGYIDDIQEVYQMSDLYIFPVVKKNSSIGMPLSILEARSCGLPVITTDFGSIKQYLGNDRGGITYSDPNDFKVISDCIKSNSQSFEETTIHEINNNFIDTLNRHM